MYTGMIYTQQKKVLKVTLTSSYKDQQQNIVLATCRG